MRARMPDDRRTTGPSPDDALPPSVARAARSLRREVPMRPEWRARVLADIGQVRQEQRRSLVLSWPKALAAGLALFVAGGALVATTMRRDTRTAVVAPVSTVANSPKPGATRFVFVAPNAHHVALVGDFNLWNPSTAPMQRIAGTDAWVIDMNLPQGRHVYAFVVDGDVTAELRNPRLPQDVSMRLMRSVQRQASRWSFVIAITAMSIASTTVRAQQSTSSLSQLTRPAQNVIHLAADSLTAEGLPGDALVAKAAEGVLKGADETRILFAVRRLSIELREARSALGTRASSSEIIAAASALHAGASADVLRQMRALAAPDGAQGRLAVPLVVLADLVSRGTPVKVAGESVLSLLAHHATDADLQSLRADVERDILSGGDPASAAIARSRALSETLSACDVGPISRSRCR
jgi:hypothetical protein